MNDTDNEEEKGYSSSLEGFSHDVDESVWGWSTDSDKSDPYGQSEDDG
jgi:hypothetical protein